jgi:hypothetical protein
LAHLGHDGETVEPAWHHQIEEHDVDRLAGPQHGQPVLTALGDLHFETEATHHRFGEPALDGIVVDDEDRCRHAESLDRVL